MKVIRDIAYGPKPLNKMDLYYPDGKYTNVLIHFHGGGIESGDKCDPNTIDSCEDYAKHGILIIEANYSMYPTAKFPEFIIDCAKCVAYVQNNLLKKGDKLYVSGQSAGAWLSLMLAFDTHYLKDVGVDPLSISGWFIDSAQTTAHFNVLREFGYDTRKQIIDEKGPQFFVDSNTKFSKVRLVVYTNDMPCRYEQNMLFYKSILQFNPDADISIKVLEGGHCDGSINKVNGRFPINELFIAYLNN